MSLLAHLVTLAQRRPQEIVLRNGARAITRAELDAQVGHLADRLAALDLARVSTSFDNGIEAVVVSLALRAIGAAHVPLPGFFSAAQCAHAQAAAAVEAHLDAGPAGETIAPGIHLHRKPAPAGVGLPVGTSVVTFTSGSTGTPKGVCLSASHLETVSKAIVDALAGQTPRRHLALLPLAVLLEQVAGVEAALWAEAEVLLPASADTGLVGAAGLDPARLAACIAGARPESLILVPQMLQGWLWALDQGAQAPDSLRFAAVGGARVPPGLLQAAAGLGLPVYEGYGLSECASVVCLNRPGAHRAGTVGRALPHVRIEVDGAGEVLVHGPRFLGYLGEPAAPPGPWATGDLGRFDEDGFLAIDGRRRNVYITAFGRNVSPEWVESELSAEPEIAHAVVDGEARAETVAIIAPARSGLPDGEIAAAIARANARLPDYARVHRWLRAREAFTPGNGLLTGNGRVRRAEVLARHAADFPPEAPRQRPPQPPQILSTERAPSMSFFEELIEATASERAELESLPLIADAFAGRVTLEEYRRFLTQAYHHVKHTVPLLMACGARLPERLEWLREAVAEYIEEEQGHQEWILDDLRTCGADAEAVRHGRPEPATELMVAYAWDTVMRGNPVGFFGMVLVLEGTSKALALGAASALGRHLGLPRGALRYLSSHGQLDQEHVDFYRTLMDRLEDPADRAAVVHAARMFYGLYADVFRSVRPASRRYAEAA